MTDFIGEANFYQAELLMSSHWQEVLICTASNFPNACSQPSYMKQRPVVALPQKALAGQQTSSTLPGYLPQDTSSFNLCKWFPLIFSVCALFAAFRHVLTSTWNSWSCTSSGTKAHVSKRKRMILMFLSATTLQANLAFWGWSDETIFLANR